MWEVHDVVNFQANVSSPLPFLAAKDPLHWLQPKGRRNGMEEDYTADEMREGGIS